MSSPKDNNHSPSHEPKSVRTWEGVDTYSCQFCGKTLETNVEQDIILGIKPLCSNSCGYKLIYTILSEYPKETLVKLYNYYFPKRKIPKEHKFVIFEISNQIAKPILSSLIPTAHGSAQNITAQKHGLAHGSLLIVSYKHEPSQELSQLEPRTFKKMIESGFSKSWIDKCLNCKSYDCHAYSDVIFCFSCKLRRKT